MTLQGNNITLGVLLESAIQTKPFDFYISYSSDKKDNESKTIEDIIVESNVVNIIHEKSSYNSFEKIDYFSIVNKDSVENNVTIYIGNNVIGNFKLKPTERLVYVDGSDFRIDGGNQSSAMVQWGFIAGNITEQADLVAALQSKSDTSHSHNFLSISAKPTTLSGYGITDAYPLTGNPSAFLTSASLSGHVPYTGATANVSLGANSLFATSVGVGISSSLSATLHVRGISTTVGNAFLVQNSGPTNVLTVSNAGLTTLNPQTGSGDALEITNNGYIKQGSMRFRGSGIGMQWVDASYASFFSISNVLTTSKGAILQTGLVHPSLGPGFGAYYVSVQNTYTNILGGYLHGLELKNNYNPSSSAGGIFRDLYIAPTIGVGVQDWRGVEVVSGNNLKHTLLKLNNGSNDIICVKGDSKIGIFGATPIAKATTSYASSTMSSPGGGVNIKTDDTFNGYTISQVINYLKDFGFLT